MFFIFSLLFSAKIEFSPYFSKEYWRIFDTYGFGMTSRSAQILSRSSRNWFDITPVAGMSARVCTGRVSIGIQTLSF